MLASRTRNAGSITIPWSSTRSKISIRLESSGWVRLRRKASLVAWLWEPGFLRWVTVTSGLTPQRQAHCSRGGSFPHRGQSIIDPGERYRNRFLNLRSGCREGNSRNEALIEGRKNHFDPFWVTYSREFPSPLPARERQYATLFFLLPMQPSCTQGRRPGPRHRREGAEDRL